jgi:hypothetical protein
MVCSAHNLLYPTSFVLENMLYSITRPSQGFHEGMALSRYFYNRYFKIGLPTSFRVRLLSIYGRSISPHPSLRSSKSILPSSYPAQITSYPLPYSIPILTTISRDIFLNLAQRILRSRRHLPILLLLTAVTLYAPSRSSRA